MYVYVLRVLVCLVTARGCATPTVSHELLSSKHKSSSLAGTARTAASGVYVRLRGAREPRERTASETGSPTRYVRVVLDVNDVTERGGLIGTFDLTKTRGR